MKDIWALAYAFAAVLTSMFIEFKIRPCIEITGQRWSPLDRFIQLLAAIGWPGFWIVWFFMEANNA